MGTLQVYYIYCPKLQYTGPRRAVGNMSDNRCCLTADPGVASFVEIDHEIISMVILLLSADSFKKGCCQLYPVYILKGQCDRRLILS